MQSTAFAKSNHISPLAQAQYIGNNGVESRHSKLDSNVILPLTSLIDAFCIIVIYLLIGTQSGGVETDVSKNIQLPVAEAGQMIEKETSTVRIEKGQYFIDNKPVHISQLGVKLAELRKSVQEQDMEIVIQADQAMDYSELDPLLRAGSEAGIQKLKFAVTPSK
jgi:biopolymer transport protein ExbD